MKKRDLFRTLPFSLIGLLAACAVESPAPSGDGTTGGAGGAVDMGVGGSSTGGMAAVPAAGGMIADPCAPAAGTIVPQVTSVLVTSPGGGAPVKGEPLVITIALENAGTGVGPITVSPKIDSMRFSDFEGVPAGSAAATLCASGAEVVIETGPFLDDDAAGKHYALGSGDYAVSSIDIANGDMVASLTDLGDTSFHIATSGALLIPVVYEQNYFDVITGITTETPEEYLTQAVTRPVQVFTPNSMDDPDGAGSYQDFPGGFDEMMGVKHLFRAFPGFPGDSVSEEGWCEDGRYYGEQVLGLSTPWGTGHGTQAHRHGFDYLIGLHTAMGGGVACSWQDVQISSLINNDIDRQQIVAVHESGHLFGAPHCNDLMNGSGDDLLGYVMCSGEIHSNYPANFVFHSVSRGKMASVWD